jgi:hypothetical protein
MRDRVKILVCRECGAAGAILVTTLISDACNAIRLGFFDEAQAMLDAGRDHAAGDAAWLNLVGVLHEQRSEWKMARRYYGRAIRADSRYEPSQQNMRRLYELATFGHCAKRVALGDEVPALIALLRTTDDAATELPESAAELDGRYNQAHGQGQASITRPRLGLERLH